LKGARAALRVPEDRRFKDESAERWRARKSAFAIEK
jgi:hypothetical protein